MKAMQSDIRCAGNATGWQAGVSGRAMSNFAKLFVLLLSLAGLGTWSGDAMAALKYARTNGNWGTNGTWSSASCAAAGATTAPTVIDDVTICPGVTVTMNGNSGAARSLTINGIANWANARTTNVGAGGVIINAGGNITGAANGVLTSTGGLTINATLISATVTITLQTTATQTISGTGSLAKLTVNSPVVATNTGNLTVTTALAGTGNFTNGTNSQLHYNSTTVIGVITLTASATGNLVDYGAAGNQTLDIPATNTYYHLSLSGGSGTKTMPTGTYTLAGNFTLNTGVTYNGTTNNPVINLAGNFSNSGTFNSGTGTFNFNGAAAQSLTGATTFSNLTVSNAAGLTINNDVTVGMLLTLTSGAITTGANTLIANANCPGSVSRTSGYVIGNLQLTFPAGATPAPGCIFHVGDSIGYAPATVALTGATAGKLTGRVDSGDHPDTIANISGIDQTKSANRYWTLGKQTAPADTLTTYTNYNATFQFCAGACTNVERDASATVGNFIVAKKYPVTTGSWIRPAVGTRTATSTQATGITPAQGFGAFAVGEPLVGVYKGVNQLIDLREVY